MKSKSSSYSLLCDLLEATSGGESLYLLDSLIEERIHAFELSQNDSHFLFAVVHVGILRVESVEDLVEVTRCIKELSVTRCIKE